MTRSTAFIPVSSPPASGLCYTEEARAGRGLFVVLQDVAPGAGQVRESFIRAVYREIVTRFQSAVHPETSEALLRGVVRSLDGVARQVETRVADFRGLGIHILVFEGRRASLLCGRDVPARVRVGGLVIPVAAGVAGARELPIETVRAQQDLFAQSLTDSLTLYRFELKEPGGVEFFLGGLQEDVAAALDALEVSRPGGRVVLERASHVVLHVPWAVTERGESAADRNAARAVRPPGRRLPLTRVALAVAGVLIAAAGYAAIRDLVGRGGGEEAQSVRATQGGRARRRCARSRHHRCRPPTRLLPLQPLRRAGIRRADSPRRGSAPTATR